MADADRCKIDALIERYDFDAPSQDYESLNGYLLDRWTEGGDGYGTLTARFNKRLLQHVYETHGRDTLETRLNSEYETLRGDDEILRRELMDDLVADGIDADQLVEEFVSRSTMRRHLKNCLNGQKKTPSAETNWERESIEIALSRAKEKTSEALRSLHSKGEFVDVADVDVTVTVGCSECPTRIPLREALARGYVCETHHSAPDSSALTFLTTLSGLLVLSSSARMLAGSTPLLA
ncbi:rod-determining factor RdfA [Halobacterium hubeiense]|uniref:rod-determining factor RdfA n=1 Tax=Halobacterium hubeiense TaxID=1407499 RepID=UPI0015C606AB|nr:rod-determining factor RdfA [Halobacterium hubeiense]